MKKNRILKAASAPETPAVSPRRAVRKKGPVQRRTQQERRETTSAALIEATVAAISDRGYAGLRTGDITERAGVTWGAVQHLFGGKNELLLEVVVYAAENLLHELQRKIQRGGSLAQRVHEVVELTWRVYSSPAYFAMIEIVRGARAEPALHERIAEEQQRVRASITSLWIDLFEDAPVSDAQVRAVCDLVTLSLSGLASRKTYLWPQLPSAASTAVIEEIACDALQRPLASIAARKRPAKRKSTRRAR